MSELGLDMALKRIHVLASGLAEAKGYLRSSDAPGRSCPVCRGVDAHQGSCELRLALDAIDKALAEVVEA